MIVPIVTDTPQRGSQHALLHVNNPALAPSLAFALPSSVRLICEEQAAPN